MSDEQHTALPWKLGPTQDTVDDANGNELLQMQAAYVDGGDEPMVDLPYAANAAFIVRAVNNHYALVAACKELMAFAKRQGWFHVVIQSGEAAIAKAEEQP
jgi:hypothetical protein